MTWTIWTTAKAGIVSHDVLDRLSRGRVRGDLRADNLERAERTIHGVKENKMDWLLCIGIAITWILASALLVWVICANSSRISRIDEPFKDQTKFARSSELSRREEQHED